MTLGDELVRNFPNHFRVLILDNEVTVDAFVQTPALPWARLVAAGDAYRVDDGYPGTLDAAEAEREERNWDQVADEVLIDTLGVIDGGLDLIAIGNNAGQGLALALAVPERLRAEHAAIIYGRSLPEQSAYEAVGYRQFCPRGDLLARAEVLGGGAPIALGFINTIEHNEQNYHTPWDPREDA